MSDTETTEATPKVPEAESDTFSRDYVEALRNEAAKYRTEKKDAVEEAQAKTRAEVVKEYEPELAERDSKIASLTNDLNTLQVENQKLRAVLGAEGVAAGDVLELVELVQGEDEESISDSVKRVLKFYNKGGASSDAVDPTQGHGNHMPLNGDPVLDALKRAVGA